MPDAFVLHVFHYIKTTYACALLFGLWPLVFGLGASALSKLTGGEGLGLGEAIRRSVSSYLGFDKEVVYRGGLVLHRIVGALAWAYVVAIFVASMG